MEDIKDAARRAVGTLDTIAKSLADSAHPEAAVIRKMAAKESADLMAALEPVMNPPVDNAEVKTQADKDMAAAKVKADQVQKDKDAADKKVMSDLTAGAAKKP